MSRAPRVLVVDDDRRFRSALVEQLTDLGCATYEESGATGALSALEEEEYDLVLLDLRMPGLSGHDLLRRLRRSVRVIGMSGAGTLDDVVALMRRGAVDFLRKPFEDRQLEVALRRALGPMLPDEQSAPRRSSRVARGRSGPIRIDDRPEPPSPCERLDQAVEEGAVELPVIAPIAGEIRRLLADPCASAIPIRRQSSRHDRPGPSS